MTDAIGEMIPVTARAKAWVFSRLHAEIAASKPAGGHECLSLVSVVCDREAATTRIPGHPEPVVSTDAAINGFDLLCRVWVLYFASLSLCLRC